MYRLNAGPYYVPKDMLAWSFKPIFETTSLRDLEFQVRTIDLFPPSLQADDIPFHKLESMTHLKKLTLWWNAQVAIILHLSLSQIRFR